MQITTFLFLLEKIIKIIAADGQSFALTYGHPGGAVPRPSALFLLFFPLYTGILISRYVLTVNMDEEIKKKVKKEFGELEVDLDSDIPVSEKKVKDTKKRTI